ncbi:purine-cytosine permease family protein [Streptacidiphilus jiangxiensis]|uniref:Nucleobase:cation symporter-1, NCS1 family n=1 Tax=Streptacidiphilus jiangxiensis TaxID=235985 RepID=A0A1H7N7U6_STRJI|nr:cytosine permease [Streptacidiphilus jiangxiensis]SEL19550.1 nucleobase:cation symporter-1, NCS1 family [Streptacidiphilus jiangxiensis]
MEQRALEFVPETERYGSPRSLFTVWFAANMQITTIVTGALGVVLGLPLPWAVLALVVGNLFGGVFMALHSAQGPKLGIPQMIQSRAQFGVLGAVLPLLLVILMYIGFFASSSVLGGAALAAWTGLPHSACVVAVAAVCVVLALYGYRLIHQVERWISLFSGLGFVYLTYRLLSAPHPAGLWHAGSLDLGTFLLVVSIAATWQITYAPYVADYSRYLPTSTRSSAAFWWTYAGSVGASVWMMAFGCVAASLAPKAFGGDPVAYVVGLAPGSVSDVFFLMVVLGVLAVNVLNLYGTFMSTTTTLGAVLRLRVGQGLRAAFILGAAAVGAGIALLAQADFLATFENFILLLTYFLVPWTAVNLVDFYLIRRERYDIPALFDPNGRYGRVNWRTMTAYLVGVAVEVPFVSTSYYTGPMVAHLGGADISWILGLIVSAALYYGLMRGEPVLEAEPAPTPAVAQEPRPTV